MKTDLFELIMKILIFLVMIIILYIIILKIIGKSPNMDELQNMFLILIVSLIITLYYKFGKFESKLDSLLRSFSFLAKDFKKHIEK